YQFRDASTECNAQRGLRISELPRVLRIENLSSPSICGFEYTKKRFGEIAYRYKRCPHLVAIPISQLVFRIHRPDMRYLSINILIIALAADLFYGLSLFKRDVAEESYMPRLSEVCPTVRSLPKYSNTPFSNISPQEQQWYQNRVKKVVGAFALYLKNAGLKDVNPSDFLSESAVPLIGLAFSGGGNRAATVGAGEIKALDGRETTSITACTGGLLQVTVASVGLSGGSWTVASWAADGGRKIDEMVGSGLWDYTRNIILPYEDFKDNWDYWKSPIEMIKRFTTLGLTPSVTDFPWAAGIRPIQFYKNLNDKARTFSSLRELPAISSHDMPLPNVVVDVYIPNESGFDPVNLHQININPFNSRITDPDTSVEIDTQYLGSNAKYCMVNFDTLERVVGVSSSVFAAIVTRVDDFNIPSIIKTVIKTALGVLGPLGVVVAEWPNFMQNHEGPFKGASIFKVFDAGISGKGTPVEPLLYLGLDFIIAFDNNADDKAINWSNGKSGRFSYQRGQRPGFPPYPKVPETEAEYEDYGYKSQPALFGCYEKGVPMVLNIPNAPWSTQSNYSTFDLVYSKDRVRAAIDNGWNMMTQAGDPKFGKTVACAAIYRSSQRLGIPQTEECQSLFKKWCYSPGSKPAHADPYPPNKYYKTGERFHPEPKTDNTGLTETIVAENANAKPPPATQSIASKAWGWFKNLF
ncbi:Lysophospholipase 1, partial [Neolecta irregularis DAH-3]